MNEWTGTEQAFSFGINSRLSRCICTQAPLHKAMMELQMLEWTMVSGNQSILGARHVFHFAEQFGCVFRPQKKTCSEKLIANSVFYPFYQVCY